MNNRILGVRGVACSIVVLAFTGCSNAAREASNNDAPVAQITLTTANSLAHVGAVLKTSYQYSDSEGDAEGNTVKVWLRDSQPIEGADQDNYTVTAKDSGKKLHYRVTPAAASGKSPGVTVASPEITIENSAPSITNVVIGGSVNGQADGRPLTVSYSFQDLDEDGEGVSTYEWRRNGIAIGGATEKTYTPTFLDVGKTITVAIKPFAHTGASPGPSGVSNPITVPNVALNAVSVGLKQLSFSWTAVPGANTYRVSYSSAEGAGFVPVSTDSSNLTATTYDWDIAVHRINWPKAQFMLEACDANNICLQSASISALNVMLGAIGYFKASNAGANDQFGYSVALSGDGNTLAVGAYSEDSSSTGINSTPNVLAPDAGAVYVYTRSGITWTQQAYVKASNTGGSDWFGRSVALSGDGNTLAVAAHGEDSANIGVTPGAPTEAATLNSAGASGAVYIYTRNVTTWSQHAYVKASNTGSNDAFGISITLSADGNTLAVGAFGEASNSTGVGSTPDELAPGAGAVYVYTRSATIWAQQAYVKASNTGTGDRFGVSVALNVDGNTLAVGAIYEGSAKIGITPGAPSETDAPNGSNSGNSGAVYVFTRSGTTWTQQAYVKASNIGADDRFGVSVALSADGNTLAVGAIFEDSAKIGITPGAPDEASTPNGFPGSGAVYVFTRSGATWSQQAYVKASNTGASDWFGYSVALSADGNTLVVGAFGEDSAKTGITPGAPVETDTPDSALGTSSGAVYVFTRSGATWSQQAYVKAPNTDANDGFGISVALNADGNTLTVGAYGEASNSTGVNSTPNESAPSAGAVYLY